MLRQNSSGTKRNQALLALPKLAKRQRQYNNLSDLGGKRPLSPLFSEGFNTMSDKNITPLQLMSAKQILIPVSDSDDFEKIQKRLFDIGAGWQGGTIGELHKSIETVRPIALVLKTSGMLSLVMFEEDLDLYESALTIPPDQLFSTSLSAFKQRIEDIQKKKKTKQEFNEQLNLLKQIPEDALTDEVMQHIKALQKFARKYLQ